LANLAGGMKALAEARDALTGPVSPTQCGASGLVPGGTNIQKLNQTATAKLNEAFNSMTICLSAAGKGTKTVGATLKGDSTVETPLTAAKAALEPLNEDTVITKSGEAKTAFQGYKTALFDPAKTEADKIPAEYQKIAPALQAAKEALALSGQYLPKVQERLKDGGSATGPISTFQPNTQTLSGDALKKAQEAQKNLGDILKQQQTQYGTLNAEYLRLKAAYESGCPLVGVQAGEAAVDPGGAKVNIALGNAGKAVDGKSRPEGLQFQAVELKTPQTLQAFVEDKTTIDKLPTAKPVNAEVKTVVETVAGEAATEDSYAKFKGGAVDNLTAVGVKVDEANAALGTAQGKMQAQVTNPANN